MEERLEEKPTTYNIPEGMTETLLLGLYLDLTQLFILQIKKLNFRAIKQLTC